MHDLAIDAPDLSRQGARGAKPVGRIRPGSEAHLRLLCLELLETHDPYKPSIIDWPRLDEETRHKIVSLPIWDIAVQTEGRASMNVKVYGERLEQGLLKEAVEMDAFEESRHKLVLSNMVAFYGHARPEACLPHAKEAAQKAIALDPLLAEAHTSLAMCHLFCDWDRSNAEREFLRSLELKPGNSLARSWYGMFYLHWVAGRFEEGLAQATEAVQIDPLSAYARAIQASRQWACGLPAGMVWQ